MSAQGYWFGRAIVRNIIKDMVEPSLYPSNQYIRKSDVIKKTSKIRKNSPLANSLLCPLKKNLKQFTMKRFFPITGLNEYKSQPNEKVSPSNVFQF